MLMFCQELRVFGPLNFRPQGHKRAFWKCIAPDISGAAMEERGGGAKKISSLIRKRERAGVSLLQTEVGHKRFIHL